MSKLQALFAYRLFYTREERFDRLLIERKYYGGSGHFKFTSDLHRAKMKHRECHKKRRSRK